MQPELHFFFITVQTYGAMMLGGMATGFFLLAHELRRYRRFSDSYALTTLVASFGLLGARAWHLMQSTGVFVHNPVNQLIWDAGYAWYGGLSGGLLAVIIVSYSSRTPLLVLCDLLSAPAAIGYMFGRIGCFMAGDGCYGRPTSLPWGMSFPNGIIPTHLRVHPTPVYEAIAAFALFVMLWSRQTKIGSGERFGAFLLFSGLSRFFVEFLRLNPKIIFGVTEAQLASILATAIGVIMLWSIKRVELRDDLPR
jgi:phosphatidylglycerol---prolipoprotein diacylglyceryl transferase